MERRTRKKMIEIREVTNPLAPPAFMGKILTQEFVDNIRNFKFLREWINKDDKYIVRHGTLITDGDTRLFAQLKSTEEHGKWLWGFQDVKRDEISLGYLYNVSLNEARKNSLEYWVKLNKDVNSIIEKQMELINDVSGLSNLLSR